MYGGDFSSKIVEGSFEQALAEAKRLINYDGNRCSTISFEGTNRYKVYLKDCKKTNPQKSTYHHLCTTVFFGRTI
jgi:hypothetical protein